MITARPFLPYVVTLADGRTFTIRHPDLVACDERGRGLQVNTPDGLVGVEMFLVRSMHQLSQQQSVGRTGAE
jgi:hypothetical protein